MGIACHRIYEISENSQIGEARRDAVSAAQREGFDETQVGRIGLIITELGTNLVRHAHGGRLLIAMLSERTADSDGQTNASNTTLEVIAVDKGPGTRNLDACMVDGYSTGGTSGNGLGAVKRLADCFDAYSHTPSGTVILARVVKQTHGSSRSALKPSVMAGGVSIAAPGETLCGDAWSCQIDGSRASLLVADGLGHGPSAHEAAARAVAAFDATPHIAPMNLVQNVHERLRGSRGAAIAVARVDAQANAVTLCGAGNIAGRLMSGTFDRSILSQHGTAGLHIPHPQETVQQWPPHAVFVAHSDGVVTRWTLGEAPGLLSRHPVVIAAWILRDSYRGRDDATVIVVKRWSTS